MAEARFDSVLAYARRLALKSEAAGTPDSQLLDAFVQRHDEKSFAELVDRHGPMILGVCRRLLRDTADAEDAFQATFFVLCRKARSIRKGESLGSWLHSVALRAARKCRLARARRTARERMVSRPEAVETGDDITWAELRGVLDEELGKLSSAYRAPLILCFLEGRTQDEAARQLGWSKSTLRRRLERGRALIQNRLTRRGITLTAGLATAWLSESASSATVPPLLVSSTVKGAVAFAAGQAGVGSMSTQVAGVAKGVLRAMMVNKLKAHTAVLLMTSLIAISGGLIAAGATGSDVQVLAGDEPMDPLTQDQTKAAQGSDDSKNLQGEWQAVDGEKGGKPIAEDPSDMRIVFKGDEIDNFGNGKMKYMLDTGKSPRELQIEFLDGKLKGQKGRMIYSLDKDELKLCMPLGPGIPCPKEFKTKPGSNLLLLVLRRVPKDGAGLKRPYDLANIKRDWSRADAAPDGNYKLSYVGGGLITEETCCIIKLETKDGKQSACLVSSDEDDPITAVRKEAPVLTRSPPLGPTRDSHPPLASAGSVPIRLVGSTPRGDMVFDGSFTPPTLEARGYLEQAGIVLPATLTATDLTKLKFTTRSLPDTPLQRALRFGRKVSALRQRAAFTKDAEEKAGLVKEAASAEKEALALAPKLLREGFEKYADNRLIFEAALDAARSATRYKLPADELRAMFARADKTAASYGGGWQREFNLQIAAALAPQKDYAALALEVAARLEKEFVPADASAARARLLKALAAAQGASGNLETKETLTRLLAKVEEILDREYRAKVPPFKVQTFAGRKAKTDRAVVLELFTGTQCPPCVAACVAFDALFETYRPAELVLIQYHLHIPGPDPLANPDSEARWAYYNKAFPKEAIGVPTTLFNGTPKAGYGGALAVAEEKYKEYRKLIDPLLESKSAVTLSARAIQQSSKIDIKVDVTGLKNPAGNVRLRLLLVEEVIRYVGGNRVRLHHNVVRSLIGGAEGFALNRKDSTHTATVDLDVLRKSLCAYLEDYNNNWRPFPNSDRPLDLANLRLIALVQDDASHEILQAALVKIAGQDKTAAK